MNQKALLKSGLALCIALLGSVTLFSQVNAKANLEDLLKAKTTKDIYPGHKAQYYSIITENGTRVHVSDFDYQSKDWDIHPVINPKTQPVILTAKEQKASAAINGAYFNLADGQSASYITINGQLVSDPYDNKLLMQNPKLAAHMAKILNRSELRICKNQKGDCILQIAHHKEPLLPDTTLMHAIQAGPQLLPLITDKEEAFVRLGTDGKEVDSIGVRHTVGRTAVGITAQHHLLLVCVSGKGQDPESSGLTLVEFAALLKDLGCESALNFDGGASTTMCVALNEKNSDSTDQDKLLTVCSKQPETKVKSVLVICPNK